MPTLYEQPDYSGIRKALQLNSGATFVQEDIQADLEGEQETLPDLDAHGNRRSDDGDQVDSDDDDQVDSDDNDGNDNDNDSGNMDAFPAFPELEKTIAGASKGVKDTTEQGYMRLADSCVKFLLALNFIKSRDEFISPTPLPDTPIFIIAWIMAECDSISLDGKGPSTGPQSSYAHAQKMRASMTYLFGRVCKLGNVYWQQSGSTVSGNPSVSNEVASYMVSLRRRKVQAGETPTSARAINLDILEALYDCNYKATGPKDATNIHSWGGRLARLALQAIYILAFLCLLRIDEVLKIQFHHLKFETDRKDGHLKVTLTLPFRKTHQFGEIKPFVLHALPAEDTFICPVHALSAWIHASRITSGYLFRRINLKDRPSSRNVAMTSQQFLEMFRNNLIDIGVDHAPYGTHSFRRGGCQYYASDCRWDLRKICDWGGWSTEFTNATIVKYLLSWNDNPTQAREDFLNPNRAPATKCFRCGRSCHCA